MERREFNLEDYHLSYRTGCMMEEPLSVLPAFFEPWNNLSKIVSDLIKERRLRDEVHKLPLLDHTKLKGYRQWRLAHLQLAFITAGYVWQDGDKGAIKVLPRAVAIPFHHVSKELGVLPILCHMDLVLSNYTLSNSYGNIDCWYCLPGGEQGKWFTTVTMLVELQFAKCLKPLEKIVNLVRENESKKDEIWQYYNMQDIVGHLDYIRECIGDMKEALSKMHGGEERGTFYLKGLFMKTFLTSQFSFSDINLLTLASDHRKLLLIYSISGQKLAGGSAAQSTSLQALDALFGVCHSGEKKEFLVNMRSSMPPDHVRFIEDLEQTSHLLAYVEEMAVPALTSAYNKCIKALTDFRSYHISIVFKYVISAAKSTNEGNYKSLDEKGTGGTDLIPFLKGILHTTQAKVIMTLTVDEIHGTEQSQEKTEGSGKTSFFLGLAVLGLCVFLFRRKVLFV